MQAVNSLHSVSDKTDRAKTQTLSGTPSGPEALLIRNLLTAAASSSGNPHIPRPPRSITPTGGGELQAPGVRQFLSPNWKEGLENPTKKLGIHGLRQRGHSVTKFLHHNSVWALPRVRIQGDQLIVPGPGFGFSNGAAETSSRLGSPLAASLSLFPCLWPRVNSWLGLRIAGVLRFPPFTMQPSGEELDPEHGGVADVAHSAPESFNFL